jgi:hypothetical protein
MIRNWIIRIRIRIRIRIIVSENLLTI